MEMLEFRQTDLKIVQIIFFIIDLAGQTGNSGVDFSQSFITQNSVVPDVFSLMMRIQPDQIEMSYLPLV